MQSKTLEQYLDDFKKSSDKCIEEVKVNHITTDKLRNLYLGNSEELGVKREKFENVLMDIESLFDEIPDKEYKTLFIKHFDELSKLDGKNFEFWLNGIKFNKQIEDNLKISYMCSLIDFEIVQWTRKAIKVNEPNQRQNVLLCLRIYLDLVEGFYSNILNILIYAMIKTATSRFLVVKNSNRRGKKLRNYKNVSKLNLADKLSLLQDDSTYNEFSAIAKVCNKDIRNAIAHHSYKLNETEQNIEYKGGKTSFNEFFRSAEELTNYEIILAECFRYYSMKCYFDSEGWIIEK